MAKILRYALIGILATGFLLQAAAVTLSNREGKDIEVDILNVEASRVQIRLENGQVIWFDRALLSDESQALLNVQESEGKDLYKEINTRLGITLFKDNTLWNDAPGKVAKRLKWPQESKTDSQSSYRKYPKSGYRILDSRPYSAALYGNNGGTKHLSIVFANKGDFKFSEEPTAGEISAMERAIDTDADHIRTQLTEQFGEPERQQFGSGRGMKQLIQRWDWKGHAFLLAAQDGEYVTLKVMSTEMADNKGRSEKFSDAALRTITADYLIQRENGDNIVSNIPMVDQGPKGYCVPATFERYLRYMQIPADMYILAMAGQTKAGGGTSLSAIISSIDGYISSQNRSMKKISEPIKVRTVQKHIDKGLPIIWTMYSSKAYNSYANERTKARRKVTDWKSWEKHVKSDARSTELPKDITTGHACMIVGYNKETGEIAVSDSWGPSYRERWISAEQAEQVSKGSIYVIGF